MPLWTRHVWAVCGPGLLAQLHRGVMGQQAQTGDNEDSKDQIVENLFRVKRLRRLFQRFRLSLNWSCRPSFAEHESVDGDKGEDESRNQEHVEDEKAGEFQCAHLRPAA